MISKRQRRAKAALSDCNNDLSIAGAPFLLIILSSSGGGGGSSSSSSVIERFQIDRDIKAAKAGNGGELAYARLNGPNNDLIIAGLPFLLISIILSSSSSSSSSSVRTFPNRA